MEERDLKKHETGHDPHQNGTSNVQRSNQHIARDFEKERLSAQPSREPITAQHHQHHHHHRTRSRDHYALTAVSTQEDLPNANHNMYTHDNLTATNTTVYSESKSLTNKNVQLADHLSIIVGPPIVLILDLVVPCAVYYGWLHAERKKWRRDGEIGPKPIYDKHVLGLSVVAFGVGELYILLVRIVRLIKDWEGCAPLLSKSKWELDATCWVYGTALFIALIPFVVSTTARDEVIPWLFLYSPGFLMAFLGLIAIVTLIPIKLPMRVNDDPKGSRLKPIIYYAAADFISVDNFQGRKFRKRFRQRYDVNPRIRAMILHLTLFWIFGIMMYLGLISAIVWNLKFEYAWGASLGVLFGWILSWAGITFLWTRTIVEKEKKNARREKAQRLSAIMEERLSMMIEDAQRAEVRRETQDAREGPLPM